jgi:hypothetical protein
MQEPIAALLRFAVTPGSDNPSSRNQSVRFLHWIARKLNPDNTVIGLLSEATFYRDSGGRKLYWFEVLEPSSIYRFEEVRRLSSVNFFAPLITVERFMPVIRAISA